MIEIGKHFGAGDGYVSFLGLNGRTPDGLRVYEGQVRAELDARFGAAFRVGVGLGMGTFVVPRATADAPVVALFPSIGVRVGYDIARTDLFVRISADAQAPFVPGANFEIGVKLR